MSKLGNQLKSKAEVIKHPYVTERSSAAAMDPNNPVYTFVVAAEAGKPEVHAAIRELYGVVPVKVNVMNLRPKTVFIRGRKGKKPGIRKAMVFLKKGDKIDFV